MRFRTRTRLLFAACTAFAGVCAVSAWLIPGSDWKVLAGAGVVLLPVSVLPALLWHDRREYEKRDAALILPCLVLLSLLMLVLGALSGLARFPLRDGLFMAADRALGFSVPAIVSWMSAHTAINDALNGSYDLLPYLLIVAIGFSVCAEKKAAWTFLIANMIAEFVAFPLFVLLPAIGPWAGYGFAGNAAQKICEASVWSLRAGGHGQSAGIVCFPSFHAIWAIFSAWALWRIKPLRIPACVLAFLIVLSTITTGWHYGVDVFAGILLAAISLECARTVTGQTRMALDLKTAPAPVEVSSPAMPSA